MCVSWLPRFDQTPGADFLLVLGEHYLGQISYHGSCVLGKGDVVGPIMKQALLKTKRYSTIDIH